MNQARCLSLEAEVIMTPILMICLTEPDAFWVNTQEFADDLQKWFPDLRQVEPENAEWEKWAMVAGNQNFMN
jgi:hypothetical protein